MTRPLGNLAAASLLAFASLSAQASTVVLYDSAVASLPQDQGWLRYAATSGASPALVAGGTRLNSGSSGGTSPANEAGWANRAPLIPLFGPSDPFNPAFPALDPAVGFNLSFELQINAESHGNNDRAGFSAILVGSDTLGIEIGFWDNEIWAQNALFTHGESVLYGTTGASVLYDLTILGTDNRTGIIWSS